MLSQKLAVFIPLFVACVVASIAITLAKISFNYYMRLRREEAELRKLEDRLARRKALESSVRAGTAKAARRFKAELKRASAAVSTSAPAIGMASPQPTPVSTVGMVITEEDHRAADAVVSALIAQAMRPSQEPGPVVEETAVVTIAESNEPVWP